MPGTVTVDLKPLLAKLAIAKKRALQAIADEAEENFRKQTTTWSTEHRVTNEADGEDSRVVELITAVPPRARVPLAVLLTDDIKKVHGVIPEGFSPKTAPGQMTAVPGSGRVTAVSKTPIRGRTIVGRKFAKLNFDDVKKKAQRLASHQYEEVMK